MQRLGWRIVALLLVTACGADSTAPPGDGPPPGPDVTQPFPIDRGDDGPQTPGTYKGLWLRVVGMSNANQECAAFQQRIRTEWAAAVNPAVRVVNCALGGHAIERWIDPAYDAVLWDDCLARKLGAAGVRQDQVRVIYHKAANQFTTGAGGAALPLYPDPSSDYAAFRTHLSEFTARVKSKVPSAQAVYSSSRSYGGFSGSVSRGEPLSYEEGHALNTWLGQHATVDGVWYGWGAYLWAPDCAKGVTNAAGVCYLRTDYVADGVHPSPAGEQKISGLIHARFLREAWYRR